MNRRTFFRLACATSFAMLTITIACNITIAADPADQPDVIKRQFFAFDNGMNRIKSLDEKADLLKELGYDGVGWRIGVQPAEMIEALDRRDLKMFGTYAHCKVDAENPSIDERIAGEIELLKKHKTIIWLNVGRGKDANDEIAVKLINEIADMAEQAGLQVALYPHVSCYVETVEDAIRLADKIDRPNVGVSVNLCHFLKTDDEKNLESVLKKAAPRLMLVSINGADSGETQTMGFDRLIRPLGEGTFDNSTFMKLLDEIGYTGPVGLQCYNIQGGDRVNLKKSIDAWHKLNK